MLDGYENALAKGYLKIPSTFVIFFLPAYDTAIRTSSPLHCRLNILANNITISTTMKLCNILISMALSATSSVEAFTFSAVQHCKSHTTTISSSPQSLQLSSPSTTQLQMSDFDFPSAMPAKPEQTMKEKMVSLFMCQILMPKYNKM